MIAGWLAQGIARREVVIRRPPLLWPLAALLGIGALSLLQARSWSEGVPELLKWFEFAAVYLVATQALVRRQHVWWVVGALLAAGLVEVALGVYQFLGQVGPEAFILAGRFMRAYGTFRQPNPYAGYLGYLVPVAVSLTLAGGLLWWRSRKPVGLVVAVTAGDVPGACDWHRLELVTRQLAGPGGRAAGGDSDAQSPRGDCGVSRRHRACPDITGGGHRLAARGAIGASLRPGQLPGWPGPKRTEITDENFAVLERLAHWQVGWRMFEIIRGQGWGSATTALSTRDTRRHIGTRRWDMLTISSSTSWPRQDPGLRGVFLLWFGAMRMAWQSAGCLRGFPAALAIGVFGTLIYLTVHGMFDNLFVQHMQLQLALLLGGVAALDVTKAES